MSEDDSRQEEARRILDAIRHKDSANGEDNPARPVSALPEDESERLSALLAQKRKVTIESPPEVEILPDPDDIDPISTAQIKTMRKFAASDEKKSLKETIFGSIIKAYFKMKESLTVKSGNKRSCFKNGHECVHCGSKIPFAILEEYQKTQKEGAATDSKSASGSTTERK